MTNSTRYTNNVSSWRNFLERTTDTSDWINWWENIKYFKDVVHCVLDKSFDSQQLWKTMYRHPLAWFYRWNILDWCSKESEFEAKFHVFSEISKTHIHSHGYEWKSTVLDWSLSVSNFTPNFVIEGIGEFLKIFRVNAFQEIGQLITPVFWWESIGEYIEKIAEIWETDIQKELSVLQQKYGIHNLAAFQELQKDILSNSSIVVQIEQDLYDLLTGKENNCWYHTNFLIHIVLWLDSVTDFARYFFHDSWWLYALEHTESHEVVKWDHHKVWVNQAHCVSVLEKDTATLFMTKKPRNSNTDVSGWEFHLLKNIEITPNRFDTAPEQAQEYIFEKLRKLYPQ